MENKIYFVKSGEYSDTKIHGYSTSEVQAAKYCKLKNETHSYEEYYTEECECLDNIDLSQVSIQYVYTFGLDSEFRVFQGNIELDVSCSAKELDSSFSDKFVIVRLKEKNMQKAVKIACDLACKVKQRSIEKEAMAKLERQKLCDSLNLMKEQFEKTH